MKAVYGVAHNEQEDQYLRNRVGELGLELVSSLSGYVKSYYFATYQEDVLARLQAYDLDPLEIRDLLADPANLPTDLSAWKRRNLAGSLYFEGFVYCMTETSITSYDLTELLTLSKVAGSTSVGFLPTDTRENLGSSQFTMTDIVIGGADDNVTKLVLENLSK
jgi:hypothetical protein